MSRQKRESRSQKEMVYIHPAQFVLSFLVIFSGATAPLRSIFRSALNWAATNFLLPDQPHSRAAQQPLAIALPGLPYRLSSGPPQALQLRLAALGIPASPRSSLPLTPRSRRLLARQ
jgi:hypothetical protein